jgi:tripartite-type tricarboxylate transporter receptor subunit TctC
MSSAPHRRDGLDAALKTVHPMWTGGNQVSKPAWVGLLLLTAAGAAASAPAAGEDYPLRPMTVFGTTPAGTSVDLTTRFFGERIKAATGQPWIVENRPGAAGAIAAKAAATARPDGYSMIVGTSGSQAADKFLFKDLPYDPVKDFVPVARMFRLDFVLAVNPEKTPVSSVAELTAFLRAKKGRVSFGYFSASMQALAEQYKHLTGLEASPAAYRNPAQMMNELEAGDFDFSFTSAEYALEPSPRFRALAIASETRSRLLPELPTVVEAGVANFQPLYSWFGIFMPVGVPDVAVRTIGAAVTEIAQRDETRTFLKTFAGEPYPGSPEELAALQLETIAHWAYFVKLAKIDAQ